MYICVCVCVYINCKTYKQLYSFSLRFYILPLEHFSEFVSWMRLLLAGNDGPHCSTKIMYSVMLHITQIIWSVSKLTFDFLALFCIYYFFRNIAQLQMPYH